MNTMNEVFSLFLNEKIYINQEKTVNQSKVPKIDSKNAKKTIYIVEGSTKDDVDTKYEELLTKMNTAIKYLPEDMLILYLEKGVSISILQLKERYDCELIALFGNFINTANSQMNLPLNKVVIINGVKLIQTNLIQEIYENPASKTNYWNALKTLLV